MIRCAVIFFLINYCALSFSQSISYSRAFPGSKKNIPLKILNNHNHYFYLLRYNKEVHDLTVERRAKPSAEILNFTPLKLDSVNADWFDYERLDNLFFEKNNRCYFFFERILNSKRNLFLKIIDTTGKSSGFIDLGVIEKNKNTEEIDFDYKITDDKNILIIASQYLVNGATRKTARLYDVQKRQFVWTKKLPLENFETGYSDAFECNVNGDLFYVLIKSKVVSYKRKYEDHRQINVPVYFYENLKLINLVHSNDDIRSAELKPSGFTGLQSIILLPSHDSVSVNIHYVNTDSTDKKRIYLSQVQYSSDLITKVRHSVSALDPTIDEQLTYYDGTDSKDAGDKEFRITKRITLDDRIYFFSGREDLNYSKEIFSWALDTKSGNVISQDLIPRKNFFFNDRTRFKNLGHVSHLGCSSRVFSFVLENNQNTTSTNKYSYHDFATQSYVAGGSLVCYIFSGETRSKKMIYKNAEYDFIPLIYEGDRCEFLFYLNRGKIERFAILPLNQL